MKKIREIILIETKQPQIKCTFKFLKLPKE